MKIIYIANSRIPTEKAHGYQICKMCEVFAGYGHEVELVVPNRKNHIIEDVYSYYDVKRNFKITKIFCLDLINFEKIIGKIGFLLQSISFLYSLRFKKINKSGVVYSRFIYVSLIFKNSILELHSLPKKPSLLMKCVLKRSAKLIVTTSFIKKRLMEMGIEEEKVIVAADAADVYKFDIKYNTEEARQKTNLPQDVYLLGYVGMLRTMDMEKGVDIAILSLKEMIEKIKLVIVGGSKDDVEFYKKFVKDNGLEGRVIFTGMVKYKSVPLYLKSFDVLLAPFPKNEHYNYYMSPLKMFEYMAAGKPMVISDLPSIRDVLNDGDCIFCQPGNVASLVGGVKRLFSDHDLAVKISENAQKKSRLFTWDVRANKILNFIVD